MKTQNLIAACGLAMVMITVSCNRYVEYQPLKLEPGPKNELVPAPEFDNPEHLERVKAVLDFYGEKWQTNESGKLLIKRKLARDKELVWNYTNKAEDPHWLAGAYGDASARPHSHD